MFEHQIKVWLKAGIMDDLKEEKTTSNDVGTPQGGVISPLLCNVALHGMETELMKQYPRNGVKIIRYADDFIVTCKTLEDIRKAKQIVSDFLATVNLTLSEEKTRIGHTLKPMEENDNRVGFDFLGFHFRQITTSYHRGVKSTKGKPNNFRQISGPSRESTLKHKKALKTILERNKASSRESILRELTLRIQGWTRYFSVTKCTKYFAYMDKWLFWAI